MGKQLRVSQAASFLGISKGTLRHYANEGIIPCHTLPSGHRYFNEEDLYTFLNKKEIVEKKEEKQPNVYIYARVSTKKQMESGNLDRQIIRLTEYAVKKRYFVDAIFKEVASGINENRRELTKMLNLIRENKNSIVLIEYKDRLARFGYQYLQKYIEDFDSVIEIVEEVEKDDEKELVDDLIAITTSFSARIYGKRGGKKVVDTIKKAVQSGEKEN